MHGLDETKTAYHQTLDVGSKWHKQALKMLKQEGISRSALRKAKLSNSFIFISLDRINADNNIAATKTAFHEIGHAFSANAGLPSEMTSGDSQVRAAIRSIAKNTNNIDELFEAQSGIDDLGNPYKLPSRLDSLMNAHLKYMKEQAFEEARAEGFAHQILNRTTRKGEVETLSDKFFSIIQKNVKKSMPELAKKSMADGKILSSDAIPGITLGKTTSYSSAKAFTNYSNITVERFKDAITKKYGKGALDDPRIKDFIEELMFKGKIEGQKTFLGAIDSPIVTKITGGIESMIDSTMQSITEKFGEEGADYYAREVGKMLGGMPLDRSGELAAHAAMTTESILPSLADDASGAVSAVLKSSQNSSVEMLGEIVGTTRPISIPKISSAAGKAVTTASKTSTSSRIISGMQSAMKIAGIVK